MTNKTKLSWFEYIWSCCIRQGWMNCWYAFKNWADLIGNNYKDYALLEDDDPLEMCILYFWDSLEDDTQEDQEDLKLVMERKNGPTTRLTLEELSMRPTQEGS